MDEQLYVRRRGLRGYDDRQVGVMSGCDVCL